MLIEQPRSRWGMVVVLILFLGTLAAIPFFLLRPSGPLPTYEIQNFVGKVDVYSGADGRWAPAKRGGILKVHDRIRTGPAGEVDLRVPDQIKIRIKENSEAEISKPRLFERSFRYRLHLIQGNLLGNTEKNFEGQRLDISTPVLVAAIRGTAFQVEVNPENKKSSVRVLQGSVTVVSLKTRKSVVVRALEKTEVEGDAAPLQPIRVDRKEWNQLKEAYELMQKNAGLEMRQLDLSKRAGGFFEYVFDHGTFYTQNFGYANREFTQDPATGEVQCTVDYDVFPMGSFVGMYMKTRNLDIAKFQAIEFEVRGDPDHGYPESFKIEFKSGSELVRAFVPHDFKEKWMSFKYPFKFNKSTGLSEVTFLFANEKVGSYKKGVLHIRDVNLIPQPEPPAPSPQTAASRPASPAPAPAPSDTTQPS